MYTVTEMYNHAMPCIGTTTCSCVNASSLIIVMSVLGIIGGAFALVIIFVKVIVNRSKGNRQTTAVQQHGSMESTDTCDLRGNKSESDGNIK